MKSIINRHLFMAGVALILLFSSCNDFLDIKPYGKTIPKTTEEFSALINEMLASMDGEIFAPAGQFLMFNNNWMSKMEECCDNLETNLTEYPNGNNLSYYLGNIVFNSCYRNNYEAIARCNMVLDNYTEGRNSREGQELVGTAYALRGMAYFQMLRMYCQPVGSAEPLLGLPIVTRFDMEERPVRSSMETTVEQIEHDLKAALECHVENEIYRINDDAVKGMLARLYFWVGRYGEAKDMALDVLGRHPLLRGAAYQKMMTSVDGMQGNMLLRADRVSADGTLNTYLRSRPMSTRFVKLFVEKERDVRYKLFVDRKRRNKKIFFAGLRSAELSLIAMESAYHLGQSDTALRMLNEFRDHRIADNKHFTTATLPSVDPAEYVREDCKGQPLTPLLAAILNERRKELYLEGDRFYELKRNGRPEFWVMKNGLKFTNRKFMYTFPIPASDIQLNSAIEQNPGYTEMVY